MSACVRAVQTICENDCDIPPPDSSRQSSSLEQSVFKMPNMSHVGGEHAARQVGPQRHRQLLLLPGLNLFDFFFFNFSSGGWRAVWNTTWQVFFRKSPPQLINQWVKTDLKCIICFSKSNKVSLHGNSCCFCCHEHLGQQFVGTHR